MHCVLCVTTIANEYITKKTLKYNVTCLVLFVLFFCFIVFSIQTVARSGYYGTESPLLYIIHNSKSQFFLVASMLEIKINRVSIVQL